MTTFVRSYFVKFITLIFLIFSISVLALEVTNTEDDNIDWDNASPSEIHKKMWESKVQARHKYQVYQKLMEQEKYLNTQTNFDVLFYDINILVNDTTEILYGSVGFLARAVDASVSQVQVDLFNDMTIDSITTPSGLLSYTRSGDVVTVNLGQTYNSEENFEFKIFYRGHPTEGGFQAFKFSWRNGYRTISSLSEPYFARTWWPCKDRMDDKADSFHIAITVDTSLYCASNGTLDSTVINGSNAHTFYYTVHYPMVTYLFSVAISKYTVWTDQWIYNGGADTMPIVHAVYPDNYALSLTKYNITPNAITVLSEKFGLYPFPTEKYGHANFEWGGGMEHQTMTSMTGGSFGFSAPVVVHELGHQWWGDMITCESWGHIWLNEGWASYSEALYYEASGGWPSYHSYMNGMKFWSGGSIYIHDTTDVWTIFGWIVYDKGAWACHMLRGVLGDSLFFEGVNAYYNSPYKHGAATTEKFRDVFEQASGVELDWFFEDWIYGTFFPKYHLSYWSEPSDTSGYDVYLHVRQSQTIGTQVFRMPIDFNFNYSDMSNDTLVLFVDQRNKLLKTNHALQVNSIQLDPSEWILREAYNENWTMHIITFDGELSSGEQAVPYADTIQARGQGGVFTYQVTSGALPDGLDLDYNTGIISGIPLIPGQYTFNVYVNETNTQYYDNMVYNIEITSYTNGIPGDFDVSGDVSISDITKLVDYLFGGGDAPIVPNLADADGSCQIGIGDLTKLVEYLFSGGSAPVMGCVN